MQGLFIVQGKFCGVEKINLVFVFVGQDSNICWVFTATENNKSSVCKEYEMKTCHVFSFLLEANETPISKPMGKCAM